MTTDEVTEEMIVYGLIPEVDQHTKTFQIRLLDGTKVKAPLTVHHFDSVMEAFNNYQNKQRVRMAVVGRFNGANRLQGIESVEHISILDPLDIGARIDEFKLLKAGWLDGQGIAPSHSGLDWLTGAMNRFYPDDLPLPYLYPTPEGGIQAEWSHKPWEISLEINLDARMGNWHALNLDDDAEQIETLNLDDASSWQWLNGEIRRYAEVEV